MAIIKAVSSKAGIGQIIDYVTKQEKTEDKLVSGIGCTPSTAKEEMEITKKLWGKTGGRTYKHFVHSYHEHEKITPKQAHENALELARETKAWQGYEVLIATHIDKGHIHTHFIVNSVNYENGYKLQWTKFDLQELKDRCNAQSQIQGLRVTEKGKTFDGEEREEISAFKKETYQLLKKAEQGEVKSYVQEIALAVMDCREIATSRQDFIDLMAERGYKTDWQDTHKYITFTDIARQEQGEKQCKIRNNKLEKYYNINFGKEELENGFEINARTKQAKEQLSTGNVRVNIPAEQENNGTGTNGADAFIRQLATKERVAEEKRENREIERKRLSAEEKRRTEELQREVAERERRNRTAIKRGDFER